MNLSETLLNIWHVIAILLLLYAIWRELWEPITDRIGKWQKRRYKVKWTSIRDLIREDHTEFVKLQMLRVYDELESIAIDTAPYVVDGHKPVRTSNLHSMPGRADINAEGKIHILFSPDERLRPHGDRVVMVGYSADETLQEMYGDPGVEVVQPVGSQSLVYEAHFPPGRKYERVAGDPDKPRIAVYTEHDKPVKPSKIDIKGSCFDFRDGLGRVDWLRVTIDKPPQDKNIKIDWFWAQQGET
jgi:hypothetical protein